MFPVLFTIGPLTLRTMSVFLVVAFITAAFVFWRKGKEEYYPEDQVFDGFLLSSIVGFFAARVGFIVLQFPTIGWNVLDWINFVGLPGMNSAVGVLAAGLFLWRFAQDKKWDVFEVMDFWVLGVAVGLGFANVGAFFDGVGFGYPTGLPWGMVFPGLVEPHHPVQLYLVLGYFALFWYLSWAEYRYRTFRWYRASKKAAETGFLLCVFIISVSLLALVTSFVRPPSIELLEINFDTILALVALIFGVLLLYNRSGRSFGFKKKKKRLFV